MVYKLETEFNKNIYYEPETKNMLIETTTTGNNLILKMMTKPEYKNFLTNWNISNKKHWYQTIPSTIDTISVDGSQSLTTSHGTMMSSCSMRYYHVRSKLRSKSLNGILEIFFSQIHIMPKELMKGIYLK